MAAMDDILQTPKIEAKAPKVDPKWVMEVGARNMEIEPPKTYAPVQMKNATGDLRQTANNDATALAGSPGKGSDAPTLSGKQGAASGSAGDGKPKRMSYVDLFHALNPYRPETAEDRAKREKKEKREAIFSALGDGLSAMSNLYFTTQYAPNAYNASNGMSARTKDRWDKLRAEREANDRAYYQGYLQAISLDDAQDKDDRNWRHMLEREKKADELAEKRDLREDAKEERAAKKAEQDELMFQLKFALQQGKLTEQGYRNAIAEVKAGTIKDVTEAQINRLNRTGRGGGGSGRKGSGSGSKWAYYGPDGEVLGYVQTRDEAIARTDENEGVYPSLVTETEKTNTDRRGRVSTSKTQSSKKSKGSSQKQGGNAKSKWSKTQEIKW